MTEKKTNTIGAAIIAGPGRLEQLKQLLPQLAEFDQVVVVNTSGEAAISRYVASLSKKYECHEFEWRPTPVLEDGTKFKPNDWGFAAARNESFRWLRTTHGFWIDTDDLLARKVGDKVIPLDAKTAAEAVRKLANDPRGIQVWYMPYVYAQDEAGNPMVVHTRERLVDLSIGWSWIYPVHEVMYVESRDVSPSMEEVRDLVVLHQSPPEVRSSARRNLKMLRDWLVQLGDYDEKLVYRDLGRCRAQIGDTLWGLEEFETAVAWIESEFLAKHPDAPSIERYMSCCFGARASLSLRDLQRAKRFALRAIDIDPTLPDGYLFLAASKAANEEDPVEILRLLEIVENSGEHPSSYMKNPLDYSFEPLLMKGEAYLQIGECERALEAALRALQIKPDDGKAELLRRKAAYKVRQMTSAQFAAGLFRFLNEFNEHEKALQLFDYLPYVTQQVPEVRAAAVKAVERGEHLVIKDAYKEMWEKPKGWKPAEGDEPPRPEIFDYVVRRLRNVNAKRVLVVGCDDGYYACPLAKEGFEVVGLDMNENAINIARHRAKRMKVTENAKFVTGWFESMEPEETKDPFDGESWLHHFDAVIAIDQIDKCRKVDFFLGCLGDVVKDGAPVIMTTPNGDWLQGDITPEQRETRVATTVRCFTQDTLEALLLSGQAWWLVECHDLPAEDSYREGQGWVVAEMRRQDRPDGPRVRFACGNRVEPFSPDSLRRGGIGGSETAVIQVAEHMQRQGCRVVVYGTKVGIYEGVLYREWKDYSPTHESDVLVSWRMPAIFERERPNAKVTVLWTHDLNYLMQVPQALAERVDKVAVVSEFHKGHFLKMHPEFREDQIWVTRNGIDPKRFNKNVERRKHHYFYTSSRERGLHELIEIWPSIKEAIPDAVLHVGYGTKVAEITYRSLGLHKELAELHAEKRQLAEMDGIEVHGRLDQEQLAELMLSCEAWLYPHQPADPDGGFQETYCITAVEAQAAGAVPFCRYTGALPETVKVRVAWDDPLSGAEVAERLLQLDEIVPAEWREDARQWALQQTWSSLATEWIDALIADK